MWPSCLKNRNTKVKNPKFQYRRLGTDSIEILCDGRYARALRGKEAVKFLLKAESLTGEELQKLMARATGQFKFGNERQGKKKTR